MAVRVEVFITIKRKAPEWCRTCLLESMQVINVTTITNTGVGSRTIRRCPLCGDRDA